MTTILYFFWDGFSEFTPPATLTGQWSNIIAIHSENKRLAITSGNARLEVGEKGKSGRLEI